MSGDLVLRVAVLLLVVIGVSEPLGVLLSNPALRAAGRWTAASNAPLVFNQVGDVEFWANRYAFEFHDRSGRIDRLDVTNDVLARIRGPHTRTAAYVVPVGLGAIAPPEIFLPPLRFGLCDHGPLARDLGYPGHLEWATVRIESGSPGDDRRWMFPIQCDE